MQSDSMVHIQLHIIGMWKRLIVGILYSKKKAFYKLLIGE